MDLRLLFWARVTNDDIKVARALNLVVAWQRGRKFRGKRRKKIFAAQTHYVARRE